MSSSKPIYHYDEVCMNALTGHTFILASGLDKDKVELRNVSLLKGDQFKPDYIQKFPLHHIPSIIVNENTDDEICFDESGTILRYLANAFPEECDIFYPSDPAKRAIIERAMDWRQSEYMPALTSTTYGALWGLPGPLYNDPDVIKTAVTKVNESLEYLANHLLKNRKFIAGDDVSLAEFHIITTLAIIRPFAGTSREMKIPARVEQWMSDFYEAYPMVLETQSKVQIPHMKNMHPVFLEKMPPVA